MDDRARKRLKEICLVYRPLGERSIVNLKAEEVKKIFICSLKWFLINTSPQQTFYYFLNLLAPRLMKIKFTNELEKSSI